MARARTTYKVFEKKATRIGVPAVSINPPLGKIYFNQETTEWLRALHVKNVLLMWSEETSMIGIKAARSSDTRAYKLAYNVKGGGSTVTAKSFLNWIRLVEDCPLLTIEVYLNPGQKAIEFEVPAKYLADG